MASSNEFISLEPILIIQFPDGSVLLLSFHLVRKNTGKDLQVKSAKKTPPHIDFHRFQQKVPDLFFEYTGKGCSIPTG